MSNTFDEIVVKIDQVNELSALAPILVKVKNELDQIINERSKKKSIFAKLKACFSKSSRAQALSKILEDIAQSNVKIGEKIDQICALPSRLGSVVPIEFIEAMKKFKVRLETNLEFKDEDIIKEEAIGSGNQGGTTFKCKFKNRQCALKAINHNKKGHNPVESEILACKSLGSISCDYIAKPIAYSKKGKRQANVIYQLAKGMDHERFKKWVEDSNFDTNYKKNLFKSIVEQLLKVVRVLHSNRVAHGDMNHENYLISVENKKVSVQVVDFGYFYKLKQKNDYTKNDVNEMCHPVTSAIQFLNGIKFHLKLLMNTYISSVLNQKILDGISKDLQDLVYSGLLKSGGWPANYTWRSKEENLNKILSVNPEECYKIADNLEKYIQNMEI